MAFTEETIDFLWGVRLNNNREWFQPRRQLYLDHVQAPMKELGEALFERFTEKHPDRPMFLKISRIYRDARRLFGRGPYKSHMWLVLYAANEDRREVPAYWFEIRPTGYGYGVGMYPAVPALMARFRRTVDANPKEALALARKFAKQDTFVLDGEEYKRSKGSAPAPLDRWYNRKNFDLCCIRPVDDQLFSPDLADVIAEGFEQLYPYYAYIDKLCHMAD